VEHFLNTSAASGEYKCDARHILPLVFGSILIDVDNVLKE